MTIKDRVIAYQIPLFFLPALINGDYSGLTDNEVTNLEAFEADCLKDVFTNYPDTISYHWSVDPDEESFFTAYHDMNLDIRACDCREVELVILGE